jgi:HAD superfamily hydrolase (TIGR01509 family)
MIPRPIDAVIFDMDGLLLDSERMFRDAMRAACADRGLVLADALYQSMIGSSSAASRDLLCATFGSDFPADELQSESHRHYDRLRAEGIPQRPGVANILAHLQHAGIRCGVATSTATARARDKLHQAGILHLFDVLVGADDVTRHKPHPEPYLLAAARLGARPAHCVALEDSHNGVRAAAAAGMATIMVPDMLPPTTETDRLCIATLESLDHVVDLLVAAGR